MEPTKCTHTHACNYSFNHRSCHLLKPQRFPIQYIWLGKYFNLLAFTFGVRILHLNTPFLNWVNSGFNWLAFGFVRMCAWISCHKAWHDFLYCLLCSVLWSSSFVAFSCFLTRLICHCLLGIQHTDLMSTTCDLHWHLSTVAMAYGDNFLGY